MKRVIIPIVIALAIIAACVIYLAQNETPYTGNGMVYQDVIYQKTDSVSYNLDFSEKNANYIGDFTETYENGYQIPWPVYTLNSDANLLVSAKAVWIKPGYVLPGDFGEEFSSVEYVVSEGIDFFMIEDEYTEVATTLTTFDKSVKLEDIVASQPSEVAEFIEYDAIRFNYKNHSDMSLSYTLCGSEGKYYLNVCQGAEGTTALYEIKAEYVDLLTSAIPQDK